MGGMEHWAILEWQGAVLSMSGRVDRGASRVVRWLPYRQRLRHTTHFQWHIPSHPCGQRSRGGVVVCRQPARVG